MIIENFEITLTGFKILSTGVDGGHKYIMTDINYKGMQKRFVAFFESKEDEKKLNTDNELKIIGNLLDEGGEQVSLLNAKMI